VVMNAAKDEDGYMDHVAGFISDPLYRIDPDVPLTADDFEPLYVLDNYDIMTNVDMTLRQPVDPRIGMSDEDRRTLARHTINRVATRTDVFVQTDYVHDQPQDKAQWMQARVDLFAFKNWDGSGDWPVFPLMPDGEYHW